VQTSVSAADAPSKLQPLKYNHPGLVVDLGVWKPGVRH
jgi:hypothetical protein